MGRLEKAAIRTLHARMPAMSRVAAVLAAALLALAACGGPAPWPVPPPPPPPPRRLARRLRVAHAGGHHRQRRHGSPHELSRMKEETDRRAVPQGQPGGRDRDRGREAQGPRPPAGGDPLAGGSTCSSARRSPASTTPRRRKWAVVGSGAIGAIREGHVRPRVHPRAPGPALRPGGDRRRRRRAGDRSLGRLALVEGTPRSSLPSGSASTSPPPEVSRWTAGAAWAAMPAILRETSSSRTSRASPS